MTETILAKIVSAGEALAEAGQATLSAGYRDIEYLESRADDDLTPLDAAERPARLLVARVQPRAQTNVATVGTCTRLKKEPRPRTRKSRDARSSIISPWRK